MKQLWDVLNLKLSYWSWGSFQLKLVHHLVSHSISTNETELSLFALPDLKIFLTRCAFNLFYLNWKLLQFQYIIFSVLWELLYKMWNWSTCSWRKEIGREELLLSFQITNGQHEFEPACNDSGMSVATGEASSFV